MATDEPTVIDRAHELLDRGEARRAIRLLRRAARKADVDGDPLVQGACLNSLAIALDRVGRLKAAVNEGQRAVAALEQAGDTARLAEGINNLASIERDAGHLKAARSDHERALRLFEQMQPPNPVGQALTLTNLGIVLKDLDQLPGATARLEDGLALATEHGLARVRGHALTGLGMVEELRRGGLPAARERHQAAAAAYREARDQVNEATARLNLGLVLQRQGETDAALEQFREAFDLFKAARYPGGLAEVQAAISELRGYRDKGPEATRRLERDLRAYTDAEEGRGVISTLIDLAVEARDAGKLGSASRRLRRAVRLARDLAVPRLEVQARLQLGDLLLARRRFGEAAGEYAAVAQLLESIRTWLYAETDSVAYFDAAALRGYERLVRISAYLRRPREALEWAERARARALLRWLGLRSWRPSPHVPPELVVQESALLTEMTRLSQALADADPAVRVSAAAGIEQLIPALEEVWHRIRGFDPEYAAAHAGNPLSWERLRVLLIAS